MGELSSFVIQLANPTGVYYPGQVVEGNVIVHLNAEMKMKGIRVTLHGGAKVYWTANFTSGGTTRTSTFSANETYFNVILTVYGKAPEQSGDEYVLPAGQHVYPFSMQLPQTLPSSFEGLIGHVRYHVKGTIDRPSGFDHNTKCAFTVLSQLDLNTLQNAMIPFTSSNQKTLCCLCCKSGPTSATLNISRLGYVPGESIPIFAEISNLSNRTMNCSKAEIIQTIVHHTRTNKKTINNKVTEMRKGEIPAGGSEVWNGELLHIPPVPPSFLGGCNIIDIRYILKLVVVPAGASDLEIPAEIVIGTIPLRAATHPFPASGFAPVPASGFTPQPTSGLAPQQFTTSISPAPGQPSAPASAGSSQPTPMDFAAPPTYEESVFGKVSIRDGDDNEYTMGQLDYAPMYTYYRWDNQPATPSKSLK